jgi:hypothetical protein
MIFQLCDGDLTKKEKLEAYNYAECVKWSLLGWFRNWQMKQ